MTFGLILLPDRQCGNRFCGADEAACDHETPQNLHKNPQFLGIPRKPPLLVATFNFAHCQAVDGTGPCLDLYYLAELGPQSLPALEAHFEKIPALKSIILDEGRALKQDSIVHPGDWRAWSFRRWRLEQYLAKNPVDPSDLSAGDGTLGIACLSEPIGNLPSAFASLDIQASGDVDTPLSIAAKNLSITLSNLADNSARHGSRQIAVVAARQGRSLLMHVIDDGKGVSPNNRAHIFESFFTTRRDSGGTGMGLAIVRAMLEAHGGAIQLLETEQGTAFELRIPVALDVARPC